MAKNQKFKILIDFAPNGPEVQFQGSIISNYDIFDNFQFNKSIYEEHFKANIFFSVFVHLETPVEPPLSP